MPDRIENGRLVFEADEPADLQPEITLADALAAIRAAQPRSTVKPALRRWAVTLDGDLNPVETSVPLEDVAAHPDEFDLQPAISVEITDDDVQTLLADQPSALRYYRTLQHARTLT